MYRLCRCVLPIPVDKLAHPLLYKFHSRITYTIHEAYNLKACKCLVGSIDEQTFHCLSVLYREDDEKILKKSHSGMRQMNTIRWANQTESSVFESRATCLPIKLARCRHILTVSSAIHSHLEWVLRNRLSHLKVGLSDCSTEALKANNHLNADLMHMVLSSDWIYRLCRCVLPIPVVKQNHPLAYKLHSCITWTINEANHL